MPVHGIRKEHPGDGAFSIEKHLNERVLKISHNKIHEIFKEGLMVIENLNKKKQRKWMRCENEYSNSLWHMDWFEYEGKNYIVNDGESMFIIHFGEYEHDPAKNSVEVLREGIEKYSKPGK